MHPRGMSNFEWPYLHNVLSDPLHATFAACTLRIVKNLQRHRAASLRQHGFLVK